MPDEKDEAWQETLLRDLEEHYMSEMLNLESMPANVLISYYVNVTQNTIEKTVCNSPYLRPLSRLKEYNTLLHAVCQRMVDARSRAELQIFDQKHLLECFSRGEKKAHFEYIRDIGDGRYRWLSIDGTLMQKPHTQDVVAFIHTRDIHAEKIRRIMMTKLVTIAYEYASVIDGRTGQYEIFYGTRKGTTSIPLTGDFESVRQKIITAYLAVEDQKRCQTETQLAYIYQQLEENPSYTVYASFPAINGRVYRKKLSFIYLNRTFQQIMFVCSDITDAYEEEIRKNELLQTAMMETKRAGQAKQEFLSRMSHEMRTPLNGIKGMLDIMKDDPELQGNIYLDKAMLSTRHLMGLINDILDMAKIESGHLSFHPTYIEGSKLCQQLEATIRPMAEQKGILLTNRQVKLADYAVFADETRLTQIMLNVLSNAVKYTKPGGKVKYDLSLTSIQEKRVRMDFIVEDTGIGMTEDFLQKAFQPFEQDDRHFAKKGTGLGLAITQRLVALMGGKITLQSKVDLGTRVHVTLDFDAIREDIYQQHLPRTEELAAVYGTMNFSGRYALVVEDNEINRMVAEYHLHDLGFSVESAVDGRAALRLFEASSEGHYAILFMDIMMPEMDGLTATKRIRQLKRRDAQTVPIVAMTANAFAEDIHKSMEAGMNYHLSKPFERQQILAILKREFYAAQEDCSPQHEEV